MKKKLLITATELNLVQFWVPHIENFIKNGYCVDVICSNVGGRLQELQAKLKKSGNPRLTVVDLKRSPFSPRNVHGFLQMKKVLSENKYDIIITNEPVMGMVTRFAANAQRRHGARVIYFAHGFHFWKGAPILNWLLFYPMEKFACRFTDEIVTMNKEDYGFALKRFSDTRVKYIHGIGVDLSEFAFSKAVRDKKRRELGLTDDNIMIFSANELTKRKNVLFALSVINHLVLKGYSIKYYIRGQGPLEDKMREYIEANNLENNIFLLGYGKDIKEMNCAADVFLFTSRQEGLPVAVLEAMSCGLPCVASDIRGVNDLIENGNGGYICTPNDVNAFVQCIERVINNNSRTQLTVKNKNKVALFEKNNVFIEINKILQEITE